MSDRSEDQNENPLDDLVDEISQMLDGSAAQLDQTAAANVQGGQVQMRQSSAQSIDAHALHMEESAAGFVRAQSVDAQDSLIGIATADKMVLNDVTSSLLIAEDVEATQVRAFALFSARVNGDIHTAITPRIALAIGAAFAVTTFVLRLLFGRQRLSTNQTTQE